MRSRALFFVIMYNVRRFILDRMSVTISYFILLLKFMMCRKMFQAYETMNKFIKIAKPENHRFKNVDIIIVLILFDRFGSERKEIKKK